MHAWFIKNKYNVSNNFSKLVELFKKSSVKYGIELEVYNNIEVINILSHNNFKKPDFVLFWDKDVKLARYIENVGIKLYNSAEAIRICDDKSLTYLSLMNENIRCPKTIFSPLIYYHNLSEDEEFLSFCQKTLNYPLVFKECVGSFGMQVYLINNVNELKSRMNKCDVWPFILQEFVKSSFGRDLRIYVVGDRVVSSMMRENKNGDFRANIEIGGIGREYAINKKQEEMALKAVKSLKLDFAGVDILFGENEEPLLCEVNSNAYFLSLNSVTDSHVENDILSYIIRDTH